MLLQILRSSSGDVVGFGREFDLGGAAISKPAPVVLAPGGTARRSCAGPSLIHRHSVGTPAERSPGGATKVGTGFRSSPTCTWSDTSRRHEPVPRWAWSLLNEWWFAVSAFCFEPRHRFVRWCRRRQRAWANPDAARDKTTDVTGTTWRSCIGRCDHDEQSPASDRSDDRRRLDVWPADSVMGSG